MSLAVGERARRLFRTEFGAEPALLALAPGRINLIGEHVDYAGGVCLPAAVDLGLAVAAGVNQGVAAWVGPPGGGAADGAVAVASEGFGRHRAGAPLRPTGAWPDIALGVIDQLGGGDRRPPGRSLRLAIASDLPAGAGLSSSAATAVAVALAALTLEGREMATLDVARLCRRAENDFLGVPSGLMDQVACLCGQAGHALLFDVAAETVEAVRLPRALALLVLESGVPRRLAASEYGVRATEAAEALRLAGARLPRREPAASERASSHHASLAAILAGLSAADLEKLALPPPLDRRLRHIATEVARVGAAVEALVAGDLPRLGRLLLDSHASLRDDHQVSLPELDALVDLAVASGCLGARLMGAGFGGSVLAVAEAERAEAALVRIRAGHPGGRAWLLQAAGGARVLDLRDGAGPKRA